MADKEKDRKIPSQHPKERELLERGQDKDTACALELTAKNPEDCFAGSPDWYLCVSSHRSSLESDPGHGLQCLPRRKTHVQATAQTAER